MQKNLITADAPEFTPRLLIGCAGWGLSAANKHLFPEQGTHLERYAAVFPGVEINSSFYRPHRADTYARWRDSVPEAFRFSVKLPRSITHIKRLQDCEPELLQFVDAARSLSEKWGCLLVQFPPAFAYPETQARDFFKLLRELVSIDIACEPRHASWFREEVVARMAECGVAYVEADPSICEIPGGHLSTRYLRLHGSPRIYHSPYSEEYLGRLAGELAADYAHGRRIWCVFDNTASGAAIENAFSLLSRLPVAAAEA